MLMMLIVRFEKSSKTKYYKNIKSATEASYINSDNIESVRAFINNFSFPNNNVTKPTSDSDRKNTCDAIGKHFHVNK